jgi:hypothetical protein
MNDGLNPLATPLGRGRALYIGREGALYVSQRYVIRRSDDGGATWQIDCFVPPSGWKPLAARVPLAARLLRYYIAAIQVLPDGSRVAVARDGIYRAAPGETAMTRVFRYTRGSRPLNLAADGNRVLFGEYGELESYEARVYVSDDGGKTFDVGYQFPLGAVRHIHSVIVDPYRDHYWVLVGDYGHQAGFAALSKDMKTLEWVTRDDQNYRAVSVINMPDRFVYGTDSDQERNFLVAMDKQSGRVERLLEIEGSSLYASSFGPVHAISTCVEPNPACPSRECSLYVSTNGSDWKRTIVHRKDRFHRTYFQFGTIVLPYSCHAEPSGMYSGQAIQGADNAAFLLEWEGDGSRKAKNHDRG